MLVLHIINVQGRKSRHRTPDDVEEIIRINAAQNIQRFFITDDDFARNKNWEAILDRLIWLREEQGFKFKVTLQVDTLCHRLDGFIEKAARGGCARVFIGLENIDPDALASAKKRQNKIWEYRKMLQAWKDVGVITYAGYILGFPNDTPEKIARPALKRVQADESARAYADLALSPSTDAEQDEMDLIQMFKGAIPRTHGAPGFVGKRELRPALP